jgi:hypothetical protein
VNSSNLAASLNEKQYTISSFATLPWAKEKNAKKPLTHFLSSVMDNKFKVSSVKSKSLSKMGRLKI